jgi:hypothetical protein
VRLLILSTPKTGSTWLRHLLACIYGVPQVDFDYPFNPATADLMGPSWVSHQHFYPSPALLDWVRRSGVRLITMIRHPADVLISLYHHLHHFKTPALDQARLRSMLHSDFDRTPILPAHPAEPFSWELGCSVAWMETGQVALVRYEDLWRDPAETLRLLVARFSTVDADRIDMAIEQCSMDLLRTLAGPHGGFFRAGRVGDWRKALRSEIVHDFGTVAPYPEIFTRLGYTLDPADPLIDAPARARPSANPFAGVTVFDNGVPVPAIAVHAFLAQPAGRRRQWTPVDRTGPGSFFAWLNEPDSSDRPESEWRLPLTNLAMYVHRQRFDLMSAFDLSNVGRPLFAKWCLAYLPQEFGVDTAFLAPILEAFRTWGNQPSPYDPPRDSSPPLTHYAILLYRTRPDLQQAFPDVIRTHRLSFLHWIVANAGSLAAPVECLDAIRELLRSAGAQLRVPDAAPIPAARADPGTQLPPCAADLYRAREELRAAFPDVRRIHRLSFLEWVLSNAEAVGIPPSDAAEVRAALCDRIQEVTGGGAERKA